MRFVPYHIVEFSSEPFQYIDGVGHYDATILAEEFDVFGRAFTVEINSVDSGRIVVYDVEANLDGFEDDLVGFVNGMNLIVREPLELSFVVRRGWDMPVKYIVADGAVSIIEGEVVFDESKADVHGGDNDLGVLLTDFVSGLDDAVRAELVKEPATQGLTADEQEFVRGNVNSKIQEILDKKTVGEDDVFESFGLPAGKLTIKEFSGLAVKTLSKEDAELINESWEKKNGGPILAKGSGTSVDDVDTSSVDGEGTDNGNSLVSK